VTADRDAAIQEINNAIAEVDLAAPSTTKFHRLETLLAGLAQIERGRVVASTISLGRNLHVRATQSRRAQSAELFVGVVTDPGELGSAEAVALQSVRSGSTSAVLLLARRAGRWYPAWAAEGDVPGTTALGRLAEALQIAVSRVEQASPRLIDVSNLYEIAPERFRQVVEVDPFAADILAIAHRRKVVDRFNRLLHDSAYFDRARAISGGKEAVWQQFLEQNPWILGIGLTGQLLTSWDDKRLEQVVAGFSVAGAGKRTDALLRTNGSIRSLVFAEIKHHETDLLGGSEYRTDCWPPSAELAGGVAQVQQTVELAARQIGSALADTDEDGADTGEDTFLLRPRSFLILGHLGQLRGIRGGVHRARLRSFELYRRNLYEPEILTFDELLARAEWHVTLAESERKTEVQAVDP
jgi:Domain of unknown function (DUF4263)